MCDDGRGIIGCEVGRDVRVSLVGLSVCSDVGLGSDLEVERIGSLDLSVGVGRDVGVDVSALLVANSSCVTTLNPASIDDATSTGRAESRTDKAF